MSPIISTLLLIVILVLIYQWARRKPRPGKATSASAVRVGENQYEGLRDLALHASASDIANGQADPYGVIMDWGLHSATATIVAFADGSASLYLSTGGGILGSGEHEPVKSVAKAAVDGSRSVLDKMSPEDSSARAEKGEYLLHVLTKDGIRMARVTEREVEDHSTPFEGVVSAMQDVLTGIREVQEKRGQE